LDIAQPVTNTNNYCTTTTVVGLGDLTVGLRWQISQPGSVGLSLNTKLIVWYIMGKTSMHCR